MIKEIIFSDFSINIINEHLTKMGLSRRERQVCLLIPMGYSNQKIADRLGVRVKTVKFHATNVFKFLNITSRADIIWSLPLEKILEARSEVKEGIKFLIKTKKKIDKHMTLFNNI